MKNKSNKTETGNEEFSENFEERIFWLRGYEIKPFGKIDVYYAKKEGGFYAVFRNSKNFPGLEDIRQEKSLENLEERLYNSIIQYWRTQQTGLDESIKVLENKKSEISKTMSNLGSIEEYDITKDYFEKGRQNPEDYNKDSFEAHKIRIEKLLEWVKNSDESKLEKGVK